MLKFVFFALALLLASLSVADTALDARLASIFATTPLIDGHNDFPRFRKRFESESGFDYFNSDMSGQENPPHTDIPRLKLGGVGAQFWSAYVGIQEHGGAAGDTNRFLKQIDYVYELVESHPDHLEMAYTSDDWWWCNRGDAGGVCDAQYHRWATVYS